MLHLCIIPLPAVEVGAEDESKRPEVQHLLSHRCHKLCRKARGRDSTSHAAGFPRSRGSPALLGPVLGHLALVDPVGLCCSLLPGAAGHGLDEIVLVHEPKHTFLAGRHKAAP